MVTAEQQSTPGTTPPARPARSAAPLWSMTWRALLAARGPVFAGFLAVLGGSAAWLAMTASARPAGPAGTVTEKVVKPDQLRRVGANNLVVPAEVAARLGVRTALARPAARPIKLPHLHGTLALDNNCLVRVHARFAGEVVALGTTTGEAESSLSTQPPSVSTQPVRFGDRVRKGQLLAVIWSKDLGEKKSELVEALARLRTDEETYRRLQSLMQSGGTAERSVREAERVVQADRVAVARVERTLRSWRLAEEEIAAVRTEAKRLAQPDDKPGDTADWARVEVRAPQDGVILEKNVSIGDIIDTSMDLFKIGDLSHLSVWAHVYEEDLPQIQALPKPIRWTVNIPSRPGVSFPGTMEQVSAVIDPGQHTALVSGRVENPDGSLKVGQFVTVALEIPAPSGEIEVPAGAVVEDGRESVVFIQPDAAASTFSRQRVQVARRFRDLIYLKEQADGVHSGDRLVTTGALLLRDALEELPVSPLP